MRGAWMILLAGLAGCAGAGSDTPNAPELAALPAAKACSATLPFFGYFRYSAGDVLRYVDPDGRIAMVNDGGWCTISYQVTTPAGGLSTTEGAVIEAPAHGAVMVGTLKGLLRIAYRPEPGFAGADAFTVRLRGPIPYDVPVTVRVDG